MKIKKELLFSYAVGSNEDSKEAKEINELKNENALLLDKIESSLIEKKNLEKKVYNN